MDNTGGGWGEKSFFIKQTDHTTKFLTNAANLTESHTRRGQNHRRRMKYKTLEGGAQAYEKEQRSHFNILYVIIIFLLLILHLFRCGGDEILKMDKKVTVNKVSPENRSFAWF